MQDQTLAEVYSDPTFLIFLQIVAALVVFMIVWGLVWSAFLSYPANRERYCGFCTDQDEDNTKAPENDLFIEVKPAQKKRVFEIEGADEESTTPLNA